MKTLLELLRCNEAKIFTYIRESLTHLGEPVEKADDYLYIPTGHPLLIQAHVDTVRITKCIPTAKNNIVWNMHKDPLGGDDRCGVWIMLKVVEHLKKRNLPIPNLLFTNGEERGGTGMGVFVKDAVFEPEGVRLMVGLDRHGCNEYVTYINPPKEVDEYVQMFGFIKGHGSYSDVRDLSEFHKIPHVNLSVGYYSQHTVNEVIHFDEMCMTAGRVVRMCNDPIAKLHPLVVPVYQSRHSARAAKNRGDVDTFDDWDHSYGKSNYTPAPKDNKCPLCDTMVADYSFNKVRGICWLCDNQIKYPNYPAAKAKLEKYERWLVEKAEAAAKVVKKEKKKEKKGGQLALFGSDPKGTLLWVRSKIFVVTDHQHRCQVCTADWEECACGHIIDSFDTQFKMVNPVDQRKYWLCLHNQFLVSGHALRLEILKRGLIAGKKNA